jgi:hypothetical protein
MLLKLGIMALNAVVRASEFGPLATSAPPLQAASIREAAIALMVKVVLIFMGLPFGCGFWGMPMMDANGHFRMY